jgi:hypothetical protein
VIRLSDRAGPGGLLPSEAERDPFLERAMTKKRTKTTTKCPPPPKIEVPLDRWHGLCWEARFLTQCFGETVTPEELLADCLARAFRVPR